MNLAHVGGVEASIVEEERPVSQVEELHLVGSEEEVDAHGVPFSYGVERRAFAVGDGADEQQRRRPLPPANVGLYATSV